MRRISVVISSLVLALGLLVLGAGIGAAKPTAKMSPSGILATLNAQRSLNGIPAGITAKSSWSQACWKHDRYMDANGELTHYEQPGRPQYSSEGAWAGRNTVLAYGSSWAQGNPFEEAPIHLAQLLQPSLKAAGAYELHGRRALWGCTTTWPGYTRALPHTNLVYTYPGDGRTGVSPHYFAAEGPFTPNQILGIPARCGQELFVFVSGPALRAGSSPNPYLFNVIGATLRAKNGSKAALRVADGETRIPSRFGGGQLGYYLGPGAAILIPVKPLIPGTTYLASVTMRGNGVTVKHHWSFTTGWK